MVQLLQTRILTSKTPEGPSQQSIHKSPCTQIVDVFGLTGTTVRL